MPTNSSSNPSVFVVILNFNGKDVLNSCLSSVYRSTYPNFEVVVVDNASTDSSFEIAKNQFGRAYFIKNSKNFGFAKGNNVGIRFALEKFADYVLLLNNDACVEKNTISRMVQAAEKSSSPCIINPLILNSDGKTIWFAGGMIDWLKMKTLHIHKTASSNPYPTQYCTGCAMLISKKIFKKIGLFDERYFLYYEDADFSIRARREGFALTVCPKAKVKHYELSNSRNDAKIYWLVLSGILFFSSQSRWPQKVWILSYVFLRRLRNFLITTFKPSPIAKQIRNAFKDYKRVKQS